MAPAPPPPRLVFSDLDGTIIHYTSGPSAVDPAAAAAVEFGSDAAAALFGGRRALTLPPSTSGAVGTISTETLRLFAALRAAGVRVALVTGARLATALARLPFLPPCDALACESGGRLFFAEPGAPLAAPLVEDLGWRAAHARAAGPAGQDGAPPELRAGALWAAYRDLAAQGLAVDAASYTTAFRVRLPAGASAPLAAAQRAAVRAAAAGRAGAAGGLAVAENLGALDVYPATSGKLNAARHVMARFGAAPAECAFLCDDDNDLELAAAVGRAYLPGVTAESVRAAVAARPGHFYEAAAGGHAGTEEILRHLLQQVMR